MMRDKRSWYGNAAIVLAGVVSVSLLGWVIYTHFAGPPTTHTEPDPIVNMQPAEPPIVRASPTRPPNVVVPPRSPLTLEQMKNAAREQANQCAQANVNNDFDQAVNLMNPKAVEKLGGKDRAAATIRTMLQQIAAMGLKLQGASVGDVTQITESHSQVFAIIPEFIDYSTAEGSTRMQSFLLGVSDDGGRNWTFIDGSGVASNPALLRELLPNFPGDLVLPTH
jgi:hypothetical protein